MNEARKAALALHGLRRKDQSWLLARLPPGHRRTLREMLRELKAIGVPSRESWVRELTEAETPHDPAPTQGQTDVVGPAAEDPVQSERQRNLDRNLDRKLDRKLDRIMAADEVVIGAVLAAEPAEVVGAVLRLAPGPWGKGIVAQCPAPVRAKVQSPDLDRSGPRMSARTEEALLAALVRRIEAPPQERPKRVDEPGNGRWNLTAKRLWRR